MTPLNKKDGMKKSETAVIVKDRTVMICLTYKSDAENLQLLDSRV